MIWFEFGSFQFEVETRILAKDGHPVALTPKAADLLLVFLEDPARLFSKDQLKRMVWPGLEFVEDSNLFFQMSCVRGALGEDATCNRFIENLPKRGYRFVVPVNKRSTDNAKLTASPTAMERAFPEGGTVSSSVIPQPSSRLTRLFTHRWVGSLVLGFLVTLVLAIELRRVFPPAQRIWVSRYVPLTHDGLDKLDGSLLADGVRVFFRLRAPGGVTLANVAVGGGDTGQIAPPKGFRTIYDLSTRTSEVLASPSDSDQEKPLWAVSLIGGSPRRIGNLYAMDAKWSPNGRKIALMIRQDLYVANSDGSQSRRIARMSGGVTSVRWSPDGATLRFTESALDNSWQSIWEIGTDGTKLHRFLPGWSDPPQECCGVWTPNGAFYIFQATREGRRDLWALSERKSLFGRISRSPIRLTSGIQVYSSPVPGNHGTQLFAIGRETRGELVRYDLDLKEFVPFLGGIAATWVNFSSSGQSVAYISYPDSTIWRANRDGSGKSQITFAPFEADGLSWSPDNKWFAFRGRTAGGPWKIYLIPSSGGTPESLISGESEQAIPTWSPDGKQIAFGDVPPIYGRSSGNETIHLLNLQNRTLSDLPGSRGFWTARWSPDGEYLSALTIEGGRLMLYDFRNNKWRSTPTAAIDNPTWSRDSKYVYYDLEGEVKSLHRVSLTDGRVEEIVKLDSYPVLSTWWSGVAPDNSPLILRNLGRAEIYSLSLDSR